MYFTTTTIGCHLSHPVSQVAMTSRPEVLGRLRCRGFRRISVVLHLSHKDGVSVPFISFVSVPFISFVSVPFISFSFRFVSSHPTSQVAMTWPEVWHEGLEEASRMYFGDGNVEGMLQRLQVCDRQRNTSIYHGQLSCSWLRTLISAAAATASKPSLNPDPRRAQSFPPTRPFCATISRNLAHPVCRK